jgi:hypothetical protein
MSSVDNTNRRSCIGINEKSAAVIAADFKNVSENI